MAHGREDRTEFPLRSSLSKQEFNRIFAHLVDSHASRVLSVARRMTSCEADAQDACQETLIAMHRGLRQFKGEAQISTWIYRIAVRASLRVVARSKRAQSRRASAWSAPELASHPAASFDQMDDLRRALLQLPVEQQALLALVAQGLSAAETAAVLGVPEGTVWSRVHTARRRLLAVLEANEG